MIKELTWDSVFFKRRIGELTAVSRSLSRLKKSLDAAREDGYRYLRCRLTSQDIPRIRLLESLGFYLTDIGVTLKIGTGSFLQGKVRKEAEVSKSPRRANLRDIPELKRMTRSLFHESRFYHDPFFSEREADRLYAAWIENSVKGQAAEVVFVIPKKGFITCRRSGRSSGEVLLLGVKKDARGRGVGSRLVREAMQWFAEQHVKNVTVRTQIKNVRALKFYLKSGFLPKAHDVILGKIL